MDFKSVSNDALLKLALNFIFNYFNIHKEFRNTNKIY